VLFIDVTVVAAMVGEQARQSTSTGVKQGCQPSFHHLVFDVLL
jgi:hypothetical protein